MTDTTRSTAAARAADRSAGDLVKDLSEQVSRLVRDELKLAQVEMTAKGKRAGAGAGMLGPAACSPGTGPRACWLPPSSGCPGSSRPGWRR